MTDKECLCGLLNFSKRHVLLECSLLCVSSPQVHQQVKSLWKLLTRVVIQCFYHPTSIATVMGRDSRITGRSNLLVPSIPLTPGTKTFAWSASQAVGHDSSSCLSKAARYCALGSFHPELWEPRKLNLWTPGDQDSFPQGAFHRTLVPWNVDSCWVILGLSNKFEEHGHFKQVSFLKASLSFTRQLSESPRKGQDVLFPILPSCLWGSCGTWCSVAVLFKPSVSGSPGGLTKLQFLIQKLLGGAWHSAFPSCSQVVLILLLHRPYFINSGVRGGISERCVCCVPNACWRAWIMWKVAWALSWIGSLWGQGVLSVLFPAICSEPRTAPESQSAPYIPVEGLHY